MSLKKTPDEMSRDVNLFILKSKMSAHIEKFRPVEIVVKRVYSSSDMTYTYTIVDNENKKNVVAIKMPLEYHFETDELIEEILKKFGYKFVRRGGFDEIDLVYYVYRKE